MMHKLCFWFSICK